MAPAARVSGSPGSNPSHAVSWRVVAGMAVSSVRRFLALVRQGNLRRPPERLGQTFRVDDGLCYRIFRETVSDAAPDGSPAVLVIGFQLKLIRAFRLPHWVFQRCCLLTTPFWSGLPGFAVKLWMIDPETKRYLGIYDWRGAEHAQRYVDALTQVLRPLSTTGSVWYRMIPNAELDRYLAAHAADGARGPVSELLPAGSR